MQQGESCSYGFNRRRPTRHLPVSGWQRALFGFYCLIFGFVLPCICWGAYSSPGHPHRVPHFVFLTPVVDDPGPAASTTHHHNQSADPLAQENQATTPDQPTGQARLSLMIFSILTFVLLGGWAFVWIERRYDSLLYRSPLGKSVTLPILLPPPRLTVCTR